MSRWAQLDRMKAGLAESEQFRLGRQAVEKRYITPEQLEELLAEQRRLESESSRRLPLGALMLMRGLLTPERLRELLREVAVDEASAVAAERRPPDVEAALADAANHFGRGDEGTAPRYVLVKLLGEGTAGLVYKAWDTRLGRYVALKMLKAAAPKALSRFLREAHVTGRMAHPNIAQIYEAGDLDGRHYLTMEYIAGKTLADANLPLAAAMDAAAKAASAVHYAHEQGVIHRDLKPGNIMVSEFGQLYVTDFGLARSEEDTIGMTETGTVLGTPAYMSPEQARGREATAASDVYGLGATLYELTTGRPPFTGADVAAVLARVVNEEPVAPSRLNRRVDRDAETIILKAMEKEPERRYASAKALAEDLKAWGAGDSIQARAPSMGRRMTRWVARHPMAAAAAAGVLLAAAAWGWNHWTRAQGEAREAGLKKILSLTETIKALPERSGVTPEEFAEEAERVAREAAALAEAFPNEAEAHLCSGRALRLLGRSADAEAALLTALILAPDNAAAKFELGQVYLDWAGATRERWYGEKPAFDQRRTELLRRAQAQLGAAEGSRKLDEREAEIARLLILVDREPAQAVEAADGWIERGGRSAEWLYIRAQGRVRMEQYRDAAEDMRQAVRQKPHDPSMRYYLAGLLHRFRDADESKGAIAEMGMAIRLRPRWGTPRYTRGHYHLLTGRPAEAEADFSACIRLEPSDAYYRYARGDCRGLQKNVEGALTDLTDALVLDAAFDLARWRRGEVLILKGDAAAALEDLEAALGGRLAEGPIHMHLINAKARALHAQGKTAAALVAIDTARRIESEVAGFIFANPSYAFTRGEILMSMGRAAEAVAAFTEALTPPGEERHRRLWREVLWYHMSRFDAAPEGAGLTREEKADRQLGWIYASRAAAHAAAGNAAAAQRDRAAAANLGR